MAKATKPAAQKKNSKGAGKINQKVISKNPDSTKNTNSGSNDNTSRRDDSDNLNTGISEENSKKVADALNQVLADEFVLYTKTLNFHWNIEGRDFHALHLFLE